MFCFFFLKLDYAAWNAKVTTNPTKLQPSPLHDLYCIFPFLAEKKTMKNHTTWTSQDFSRFGSRPRNRKGLPQLLQLFPVEAVTREDTRRLRRGTV